MTPRTPQAGSSGVATELQLRKKWTIGRQIGDPSGFGRVFEARAEDGTEGVVKLIPKYAGASRELSFEDLAGVPHVVPIIDSGETADAWVIAMPRADRSLRAELEAAGGQLTVERCVPILIDIARGRCVCSVARPAATSDETESK